MLLQSHCGDEEDWRIELSSWRQYICIMLFALYIYTICPSWLIEIWPLSLEPNFFFHANTFHGRRKRENYSLRVKFSGLWKNWVWCSSINWPSNLINNVFCICAPLPHKIRETFSVLGEKEQYLYIETQEYLSSPFLLWFFNSLLCCPTTNFSAVV